VKISYVMNVLNGEPFIKYQLDSIYKFAHEIIIIEGAYKKFAHAAVYGRSKDDTIKTIENYNDIENKIRLIANDGYYDDRKEMCNEFLKHVTGDVIWQVDADEFYSNETHLYIKKMFKTDPKLDLVSFNFQNYYISSSYYIDGYNSVGLGDVNRVFRFEVGDSWLSQRPPTLMDSNMKKKVVRKNINGSMLEKEKHIIHHASLIFEDQIRDKFKYYSSMWPSIAKDQNWLEDTWGNFENKYNLGGMNSHITFLRKNNYETPFELKEMFSDIINKKITTYSIHSDEHLLSFVNSEIYDEYIEVACYINSLDVLKSLESFRRFLNVIMFTYTKIDRKSGGFARGVLLKKLARIIFRIIKRRSLC
jgi:hypothetical protein